VGYNVEVLNGMKMHYNDWNGVTINEQASIWSLFGAPTKVGDKKKLKGSNSSASTPKLLLLLLCLITIIRLVKFSYFLVGKWKEVDSNAPKNATCGYRIQKLLRIKVFFGKYSQIISSTSRYILILESDDGSFGESMVHSGYPP